MTSTMAESRTRWTGATVYNGSFTGTTIAAQFASYNDGYILDAFSFSYVAKSIASGDFDLMKTAATYSYDGNQVVQRLNIEIRGLVVRVIVGRRSFIPFIDKEYRKRGFRPDEDSGYLQLRRKLCQDGADALRT